MSEEANNAYIRSLPEYQELHLLLVPFFQRTLDELNENEAVKFKNGEEMLEMWLMTENTGLGGIPPLTMILTGRGEKLINFVKERLEEDRPNEAR